MTDNKLNSGHYSLTYISSTFTLILKYFWHFFTDKINMFEKIEKDSNIDSKIVNLSLKDDSYRNRDISSVDSVKLNDFISKDLNKSTSYQETEYLHKATPEKVYKTNKDKFNFLQTQLLGDNLDVDNKLDDIPNNAGHEQENVSETNHSDKNLEEEVTVQEKPTIITKEESNITDDLRLAKTNNSVTSLDNIPQLEISDVIEEEIKISVPPRRKKQQGTKPKSPEQLESSLKVNTKEYPIHLNPFSDDEDEEVNIF